MYFIAPKLPFFLFLVTDTQDLWTPGVLIPSSAFDDTRFSPIPASLLPSLSCSLTLLGNFEPCEDAMDWVLGTHGLRISFVHRGRRYGATYLPDVAVEQCWTKEETVESLMRKAGWSGGGSGGGVARRLLRGSTNTGLSGSGKPWDDVYDFRAIRYQGLKASASYAEWQEWRKWAKGQDDGRAQLLDPAS
jgi:AMME syndrome candidate gene 1 protein